MSLTVKLRNSSQTGQPLYWKTGKILHVRFTITPAGNYPTNGDILDLTTLFNLLSSAPGLNLPTFELCEGVEIWSLRPVGATGSAGLFLYQWAPGTTLANGTMQVLTGAAAQAALTELAAGAYPANVLNDTIVAEGLFFIP